MTETWLETTWLLSVPFSLMSGQALVLQRPESVWSNSILPAIGLALFYPVALMQFLRRGNVSKYNAETLGATMMCLAVMVLLIGEYFSSMISCLLPALTCGRYNPLFQCPIRSSKWPFSCYQAWDSLDRSNDRNRHCCHPGHSRSWVVTLLIFYPCVIKIIFLRSISVSHI